jgi:hypothetical protein
MTAVAAPTLIVATPALAVSPNGGYAVVEYNPATPTVPFIDDSFNSIGGSVTVSKPSSVTTQVVFANLGQGLADGSDPGGVVHLQRTNSAQLGVCVPGQPLVQGNGVAVAVTCKDSTANTALMGYQLVYTKGLVQGFGAMATARVNGASVFSTGGTTVSTPTATGRYTVDMPSLPGFNGLMFQVTPTDPAGTRCRIVQNAAGKSYEVTASSKVRVLVACTNAFTGALANSPFNISYATGVSTLGDRATVSVAGGPVQKLTNGNPVDASPGVHMMYDQSGNVTASRVDQGYTFVRAPYLALRPPTARGVVLVTPTTTEATLLSGSAEECLRHGNLTTAPAIGPFVEGSGVLCRDRNGTPRDTAFEVEFLIRLSPFAATQNVAIPDSDFALSAGINVQGIPATVSGPITVDVIIQHTFRGDLTLFLIAPDSSSYLVMPRPLGDSSDDVRARFVVYDAIGEQTSGTWKLKAADGAPFDIGTIDFVGLHF